MKSNIDGQFEKRKDSRYEVIVCRIIEERDNGERFYGHAYNISRGGFFIASDKPRRPGEQFHITFQIPDMDITIRCLCEVVWTREHDASANLETGYGVRFIDLPEYAADKIEHLRFWHKLT